MHEMIEIPISLSASLNHWHQLLNKSYIYIFINKKLIYNLNSQQVFSIIFSQ